MPSPGPEILLHFSWTGKLCLKAVDGDSETLLGFSADDLLSSRTFLFERIHPEDEDLTACLSAPPNSSCSGTLCLRVRHSGGHIRCLETDYRWEVDTPVPELTLRLHPPNVVQLAQSLLSPHGWLDVTIGGIDEGIIIKDRNHVYLSASPEFRGRIRRFVEAQEIVGLTDYDWLPEVIADKFYRLEKQVLRDGAQLERIVEHAGRWIHARYTPVKGSTGEICGLFVWNEDTTEAILSEEKVDPSDQSLEGRIAAQMGSYAFDVQRRVFANSPNLNAIMGQPPDTQQHADSWLAQVHPDDLPGIRSHIQRMYAAPGRMFNYEYRITRPNDGKMRWVHAIGQVVRQTADGTPLLVRGTVQDITERKTTEAALREAKEQLQVFIEHAPAALAMFDREMRYIAASRRWLEMHDETPEVLGQRHYDLYPNLPQHFLEAHRCGLAGEPTYCPEDARIRLDGSKKWARWEVLPWRTGTGEVGGIVIFTEDITDRKLTEAALRQAKEHLQQFVEHAPAALAMFDREMRYIAVSRRWLQLEKKTGDIIGCCHYDVVRDIPERYKEAHRRGLSGESLRSDEDKFEHADGSVQWLRWEVLPWRDTDGEVGGIILMTEDITDRKQTEAALRASEAKFRSILDTANEGVLLMGSNYQTESVNPRLAELLGYTVDEVCDRPLTDFMFEEDIPDHLQRMANRQKGMAEHYERRFRRKDGSVLWTLVSATPILDENHNFQGSFAMYADITDRKQINFELERRVSERTAQLEEANKKLKIANHELEAFTYSVSHDLRAPLRHIGSFSHILNETYASQLVPDARAFLEKIEGSAKNMGQLIDDLLNLARVGRNSMVFRPVDLNILVASVRSILHHESADREVQWKIGELPEVVADITLLKQVYQNLIGNALKFTRPRNPAVIEIGSTLVRDKRVLFVRDNGVGFDMKYVEKIFGAFQRLHRKEDFEGTGIGLATVQRIIQKHGGLVWAEAEIEQGATFYFTLGTDMEQDSTLQTAASAY